MRSKRKVLSTAALVAFLVACAPMTPEAITKRDVRAYAQMDREVVYNAYRQNCEAEGGYVKIERMGYATRRDEIRNVPGRRDRLHCLGRR